MSRSTETRSRDERFIKAAIAAKILSKVPVLPVEWRPEHCILLACGDFVHAQDKLTHLWERVTPNTHVLMLNGGGLLLDALSRVNNGSDNVRMVTSQIMGAIKVKAKKGLTIDRIYSMVDFDCGIGEEYGLTVQETLRAAINGKAFLKDFLPSELKKLAHREEQLREFLPAKVEVGLLFLVHDEVNDQNFTWYFSSKEMTAFLETYQDSLDPDLETSIA